MKTTADLSSYGSIIDVAEEFMDALPVDAFLNKPNQEIVASNDLAVSKGLVQGIHCYSPMGTKPCPWCHSNEALRTGKPVDYIVHIGADENGNMKAVETGGIVSDAHWYPIASDLYIHFVGICLPLISPEDREKAYEGIRIFFEKTSPDGQAYAEASIQSIKDAMAEG